MLIRYLVRGWALVYREIFFIFQNSRSSRSTRAHLENSAYRIAFNGNGLFCLSRAHRSILYWVVNF
jgi:hypothetical protein